MATSEGGPTRKDTFTVRVTIGDRPMGVWDGLTGGELDSDETKYNPGGMAPAVSLGGKRLPGNITLKRLYRLQRDHDSLQFLFDSVGKADCVVSKIPMDIDGNIYSSGNNPLVYKGKLKRVLPPEHDSTSSDAATVEIEIVPQGDPYVGAP